MDANRIMELLSANGGTIVPGRDCSKEEQIEALGRGYVHIDDLGRVSVFRPHPKQSPASITSLVDRAKEVRGREKERQSHEEAVAALKARMGAIQDENDRLKSLLWGIWRAIDQSGVSKG